MSEKSLVSDNRPVSFGERLANSQAFAELFRNKEGAFAPDLEEEILKASLVTHGGAVVHPSLQA